MGTMGQQDEELREIDRDRGAGSRLRIVDMILRRLEMAGETATKLYEVRLQRKGARWLIIAKTVGPEGHKVAFKDTDKLQAMGRFLEDVLTGRAKTKDDRFPPKTKAEQ